jgi:DNA-binding MarR family transcriptional regulator
MAAIVHRGSDIRFQAGKIFSYAEDMFAPERVPSVTDPAVTDQAVIDPAAADLRLSVMRLARRLRALRTPGDLTLSGISVLGRLERDGAATTSELAAAERITPQSMTRPVADLVERGLVERAPHPSDGRQTLLRITPEGSRIIARDRQRRDAWLTRAMGEHLTDVERDLLLLAARLLDRLAALPAESPVGAEALAQVEAPVEAPAGEGPARAAGAGVVP